MAVFNSTKPFSATAWQTIGNKVQPLQANQPGQAKYKHAQRDEQGTAYIAKDKLPVHNQQLMSCSSGMLRKQSKHSSPLCQGIATGGSAAPAVTPS